MSQSSEVLSSRALCAHLLARLRHEARIWTPPWGPKSCPVQRPRLSARSCRHREQDTVPSCRESGQRLSLSPERKPKPLSVLGPVKGKGTGLSPLGPPTPSHQLCPPPPHPLRGLCHHMGSPWQLVTQSLSHPCSSVSKFSQERPSGS